jgi:hypothetical protein
LLPSSIPTSSLQRTGQARHAAAVGGVPSRRTRAYHQPNPQVPRYRFAADAKRWHARGCCRWSEGGWEDDCQDATAARSRNDGRSRCARPGLVAPAMAALIADDETFPIYETPTDARRWWIAQTRRFPRGFSRLGCGSTIVASAMAYLRRMDFGASPLACASNVGRAQRSAASPILIYR